MAEIDRRNFVRVGSIAAIAAGTPAASTAMTAKHEPKSLAFDPTSIKGLSERLLVSHHDNNYAGAVKRLGAIQTDLAQAPADQIPGSRLNGLKREELMAHNSMVLHEIYFDSLVGDEAPGKALSKRIGHDFGSLDAWKNEFAAMGKALSGGSGWVFFTWSRRTDRLFNSWAGDHTMIAADGTILFALDMYEHAYAIDYGANAGGYVDALMVALRWNGANDRFDRAK